MFKFYKIIENINHGNFSHVKLASVDPISKDIIENNIKLKIAVKLEDDSNNIFRVNGYFGEYTILRASKLLSHPSGEYLIQKI